VLIVLLVLCRQQGIVLSKALADKHEANLSKTFARRDDGTYKTVRRA